MRTDKQELLILRTSLLRIAQALDLSEGEIPPAIRPKSWAFQDIVEVTNVPRGWNALAAAIVGRIIDLKNEHERHLSDLAYTIEQWRQK